MTTDSETMEQYLTFVRSRFLIYVLVFLCHVTSNLEGFPFSLQMLSLLQYHSPGGGGVLRSWPLTPYGANFLFYLLKIFESYCYSFKNCWFMRYKLSVIVMYSREGAGCARRSQQRQRQLWKIRETRVWRRVRQTESWNQMVGFLLYFVAQIYIFFPF